MNLIEAMKSGRRYKRAAWMNQNWRPAVTKVQPTDPCVERFDDMLADDWEIEEPAVTITRTRLKEALFLANDRCHRTLNLPFSEALADELFGVTPPK